MAEWPPRACFLQITDFLVKVPANKEREICGTDMYARGVQRHKHVCYSQASSALEMPLPKNS